MVLLTVTPAVVHALSEARQSYPVEFEKLQPHSEPSLTEACAGDPISHTQLVSLSKLLRKHAAETTSNEHSRTLDVLLCGSKVYLPPPPPPKEPTSEYVVLMARLRAEEEARAYDRMLNPSPLVRPETFSQRFPHAQFSLGTGAIIEDDELSYEEVHRQIILIINVLVSIVACSIFIWVAARHWSVPKRLGLSLGGSGAVAIAEVVVYAGYVRKVAEAKRKEKKKPEIKKIVQSWIIDRGGKEAAVSPGARDKIDDGLRHRKGKHR